MRVIGYVVSADLKHWRITGMPMIPYADDPADVEFYGFTPNIFEKIYVGYLWIFHMVPGTIDIQLTTSRDGVNFTRCCRRETFISNGPYGYYDHELGTSDSPEPIIVNDQIYIYYPGCNYDHSTEDYVRPNSWYRRPLYPYARPVRELADGPAAVESSGHKAVGHRASQVLPQRGYLGRRQHSR